MKETNHEIVLYRTIIIDDGSRRPYTKFLTHHINETVEFLNISSTSVNPGWEEGAGCEFYRYEITVPENGFVLELDELYHNEEGEVLLPPMRCRVTDIRSSDHARCRGIITFVYQEKLSTDIITTALNDQPFFVL